MPKKRTFKKETKRILWICAGTVLLLAGLGLAYLLLPVRAVVTAPVTVGEGQSLRVGIISDLQLPSVRENSLYHTHLQKALELLKEQQVDVIINAGDFTDLAYEEAYESYKAVWDSVYEEDGTILQANLMGNHDYWLGMFSDCWEIPFKGTLQRRFMTYTGAASPWMHQTVNGYHIITLSPSSGNYANEAYSERRIAWAREQIEQAAALSPDKPVIVVTHHDTVALQDTAEREYSKAVQEMLRDYPQVICFSGHSHMPLLDEKSIMQQDYTSVNTQCLSYVSLDGDFVQNDGDFIEENPMLLIMDLTPGQVSLQRYAVLEGGPVKEAWIVPLAKNKADFIFTYAKREEAAQAPEWNNGFTMQAMQTMRETADGSEQAINLLAFTAATHADMVTHYQLEFADVNGKKLQFPDKNGTTRTYLTVVSDYALAAEKRLSPIRVAFPADGENSYQDRIPAGEYSVTVRAYETFGKVSEEKSGKVTFVYYEPRV